MTDERLRMRLKHRPRVMPTVALGEGVAHFSGLNGDWNDLSLLRPRIGFTDLSNTLLKFIARLAYMLNLLFRFPSAQSQLIDAPVVVGYSGCVPRSCIDFFVVGTYPSLL